eukprot:701444-Lingulodinium_polyedra.AAC.1
MPAPGAPRAGPLRASWVLSPCSGASEARHAAPPRSSRPPQPRPRWQATLGGLHRPGGGRENP